MPNCARLSPRTVSALLIVFALVVASPSKACVSRAPTLPASIGPHDFSSMSTESRLWRDGDAGEPLFFRARVVDTCSAPIAGAVVRVVHADHHGDHDPDRWRARLSSSGRGEFKMVTVVPGYAGGLPRHIHFIIEHPAHRQLITRLFFRNDAAADPSLEPLSLILEEIRRDAGTGWTAEYEFVLVPK